jgi:hypothetical protein
MGSARRRLVEWFGRKADKEPWEWVDACCEEGEGGYPKLAGGNVMTMRGQEIGMLNSPAQNERNRPKGAGREKRNERRKERLSEE